MRRTWVASAAMMVCLTLGGLPCMAQMETTSDAPDSITAGTASDADWPSARDVRGALTEIGWVWVADAYLVWHGGPLPANDTSHQAPVTLEVFEWAVDDERGETIRVFGGSERQVVPMDGWRISVPEPSAASWGTWPEETTSDWTILAEVMDLLPLDGITRFEIRRMINEPGAPREVLHLPGGMVTLEDGQVRFWRNEPIASTAE